MCVHIGINYKFKLEDLEKKYSEYSILFVHTKG